MGSPCPHSCMRSHTNHRDPILAALHHWGLLLIQVISLGRCLPPTSHVVLLILEALIWSWLQTTIRAASTQVSPGPEGSTFSPLLLPLYTGEEPTSTLWTLTNSTIFMVSHNGFKPVIEISRDIENSQVCPNNIIFCAIIQH